MTTNSFAVEPPSVSGNTAPTRNEWLRLARKKAKSDNPRARRAGETALRILDRKPFAPEGEQDNALYDVAVTAARAWPRALDPFAALGQEMSVLAAAPGSWSAGDAAAELRAKHARVREEIQAEAVSSSPDARSFTELGLAGRFAERYRDRAMYVPGVDWYLWTGTHWLRTDARPTELAGAMIQEVQDEVLSSAQDGTEDEVEELCKLLTSFKSAKRLSSILQLAERDLSIRCEYDALDSNPELLNTPSCTVNLRTLEFRPHDQRDRITRVTGYRYDPDAASPAWSTLLAQYTCRDGELESWLQHWLGYSCTGAIAGEYIVFFEGNGANGKSTLMNVVAQVLGTYAGQLPATAVENSASHTSSFGRLGKARFVRAPEINAKNQLASSRLKALCSYETISAQSGMGCDFVSFTPVGKLTFSINGVPRITEADRAMRRRLRVVPFRAELDLDSNNGALVRVDQRLLAEERGGSAVLSWLVAGAHKMLLSGGVLPRCEAVREATELVFESNDPLASFLDECTIRDPEARTAPGKLHERYLAWCNEQSTPHRDRLGAKTFGDRLVESGFPRCKSNGMRVHKGLEIKSAPLLYEHLMQPSSRHRA